MVILGFIILLLLAFPRHGSSQGEVRGGGVLIVGPLPLVFASDRAIARELLLLALMLTAVTLLLFVVLAGWRL